MNVQPARLNKITVNESFLDMGMRLVKEKILTNPWFYLLISFAVLLMAFVLMCTILGVSATDTAITYNEICHII